MTLSISRRPSIDEAIWHIYNQDMSGRIGKGWPIWESYMKYCRVNEGTLLQLRGSKT